VFDNYRGGVVTEIMVGDRKEYNKVISTYLVTDSDNFVTIRGKKSYVIELGATGWYDVFEPANPSNKKSLHLDMAIDYIWNNAN
jgi:hypothetical protein